MNAPASKGLKGAVGVGAAVMLMSIVPQFEGMILRGYKDPIGIVTACAGHTKTAVLGRPYTREECNKLLDVDLVEHAKGLQQCVTVPLNDGQKAAFVSFTYNVGVGAFCRSTMSRKLNAGDYSGACAELSRWTKAGGRVLPGLVKRRDAERAICEGRQL
uniref:Lysozyme n=1 Tax=Pseudomonas phage Touem01 TaxID=3138548 RepID=A0AAU6W350_9VIRU